VIFSGFPAAGRSRLALNSRRIAIERPALERISDDRQSSLHGQDPHHKRPRRRGSQQRRLLDIKLPQPHPAAEDLFGAAWSACYMGAIEVAASRKKIKLPEQVAVDAEIKLNLEGSSFFLSARLDVSVPGIDRGVAQELIQEAHGICPYSKAMLHGNI
jgi:lipoyl-dependent peroxiredoxin